MSGTVGCIVLARNVALTLVISGDPGASSSGIVILVPTMVLVSAEKALQQVGALHRFSLENVSMETRSLCDKAPVTTGTQTVQFGNFMKNGGLTAVSGAGSSPALATFETSQVLLAGVSGGFSRGPPVFAHL